MLYITATMKKKEKSTEQLNLRMPKALLHDINLISEILKINKSEWIKIKIGEMVYEEKSRLLEHYSEKHKKGLITEAEFKRIINQQYAV
ncbi:MAG: hypothetical protein WC916_07200 [Candidatus Woesearchaeota archaeon]